eukprot:427469_1
MNDKQMKIFTLLMDDKEKKICIINYDLHVKGQADEVLYGIIVPNDNYKINQDKWLWKLSEFLIGRDIYKKYKIKSNELPKSSRKMVTFQTQLSTELVIEESLIDETDWFNIQQIKSLKRNVKIPKISVTLSRDMWINECKKSFSEVNLPLIPVVVNKNNNHWIEWIKIVHIESQNIHVGISLKCDESNNKWIAQSICLDRGDINNKHRLVGLALDTKNNCDEEDDEKIDPTIVEIVFSDKKINVLKQQMQSQQDSIINNNKNKINSSEVHGSFDDYYAMCCFSKITTLVNGYVRSSCGDCIVCVGVVGYIQIYLIGIEGGIYCSTQDDDSIIDDDDAIAEPDNGERLSAQSYYAMVYYNTVSKNKRDFCAEMKSYYKAPYGNIIKTFEDLQRKFGVKDIDDNPEHDEEEDNEKDIDKKINVLKQQIRSQQDSIIRLKESLLR